ncbi:MAG TPA: hypothetical protein VH595_22280 [Verrucomicrobiae bacterium]|jgi:hypothetical protein|nr:hypothetical protein [Verrucomicrobiae bacterium]
MIKFFVGRSRRLLASLPLLLVAATRLAGANITFQPVGNEGFDVLADGKVVAPIRLSADGAILAGKVENLDGGLRFSELRCPDEEAVSFASDDFVSVEAGPAVRFKLTLVKFDAARWQRLFGGAKEPFHFLVCSMPSAKMWHQRGWLNATPKADPFPLLGDKHVNTPEISSVWNRNWSYVCPLGAHPIPMIGLWDPNSRLYVGYDFQKSRASDQSERYVSTAYCWEEGKEKNFITLAFPYGGLRYGELVFPKAGQQIKSRFDLIIDTNLPSTEDPNERFQERLFERYGDELPVVPAMNDLGWIPGTARLKDFEGPIGLNFFGPGGEHTFYPDGTLMTYGWAGHREMPIDTEASQNDTAGIERARASLETLLQKYARHFTVNGAQCLFWEKPLTGAWRDSWGGAAVTTLHNSDSWYPARALVELYRYDLGRGNTNAAHLEAIDELFNWAKNCVWTRNEFPDVPSSPFAIGGSLQSAFLLDYYFTFKNDPVHKANAELALHLADNVIWRYLAIWAMDSDRFDDGLDGSFLMEPNSGRDWAGLACANETGWLVDAMTQVYVHTGDDRMRYYLRGIMQRWPELYRPLYEKSIADYGRSSMTEGLGIFDGSGPGRGQRYNYGFMVPLAMEEPVGASKMRVVAGARACIAFCKGSTDKDVSHYETDGDGNCRFQIVSGTSTPFDVSFSYPNVNISRLPVKINGRAADESAVRHPAQSPSSLYLANLRNNDVVTIGNGHGHVVPTIFAVNHTYRHGDEGGSPDPIPLTQDWTDPHSFAGLIPGKHWVFGVPYWQDDYAHKAIFGPFRQGSTVFVVYAPNGTESPHIMFDGGGALPLSGKPALAWRAWPLLFDRQILIDYATIPMGATVADVSPNGTLLMDATEFDGDATALAATTNAIARAAVDFGVQQRERTMFADLRRRFGRLPAGKIAILPGAMAGPGANFAGLAGLREKMVRLKPDDFVSPEEFNATRFPVAVYLGEESYLKTVHQEGDGIAAIARYLSEGGTLALLASGPYPMYYGNAVGEESGNADPVLARLGIPLSIDSEVSPAQLKIHNESSQTILRSIPAKFAFPENDPRLRASQPGTVNSANDYVPLLRVVGENGRIYGDAAFYVELGSGPGKGGKILYVWSGLLASSEGNLIMYDALGWVLSRTTEH